MNSINLWTPTLNFAVSSKEFGPPKGSSEDLAISTLKNGFPEEAKSMFEKIAKKQDGSEKKALFWLGMIAIYKEKNPLEGVQRLEEANTPESNYILGAFYLKGVHVDQDTKKGIEYLKKAAELGFKRAKVELGAIYYFGLDGGNHKAEGERFLRANRTYSDNLSENACQAIVNINPRSIFSVINNLPLDNSRFLLINKAALSCSNHGDNHYAAKIWKLACKDKKEQLQPMQTKIFVNLGRHYYEKMGSYQDAVEMWKPAAKQGDMQAQYYLGIAYCSGKGIKKNLEEGKKLLKLSADAGFSPAQAMLDHIDGVKSKRDDSPQEMDKDAMPFSEKERKDYIHSTKPFLSKAWSWLGRNAVTVGIVASVTAVGLAVVGGAAAGAIALTIFFPHVMIPLWVVGGGLVTLSVGTLGLIGAGFAAGGH